MQPLTGGHANKYHRGVQLDDLGGLQTIGHGGLWPGFRTEFLRVPEADLTVVVIANLATIDPWRQARTIARMILAGHERLKPASAAVTETEVAALAGTWFNAEEPSLFDLAWRNGEATVTQNGMPFVLARRADGWLAAERGSFEFAMKQADGGKLAVDLGAGRVLEFGKLGARDTVPATLAGRYVSADCGAAWTIERDGEAWTIAVSGPLIAGGPPWTVRGLDPGTIEIESPASWITATQLAHLVRDNAGRIIALEVSTGRIKKMRFARAD